MAKYLDYSYILDLSTSERESWPPTHPRCKMQHISIRIFFQVHVTLPWDLTQIIGNLNLDVYSLFDMNIANTRKDGPSKWRKKKHLHNVVSHNKKPVRNPSIIMEGGIHGEKQNPHRNPAPMPPSRSVQSTRKKRTVKIWELRIIQGLSDPIGVSSTSPWLELNNKNPLWIMNNVYKTHNCNLHHLSMRCSYPAYQLTVWLFLKRRTSIQPIF